MFKGIVSAMTTPLCELPGCGKPVFIEQINGVDVYHDYCGRTHKLEHEQLIMQKMGYRKKNTILVPANPNPGNVLPQNKIYVKM